MTIQEAISIVASTKPHSYTDDAIVGWLSTLDGIIKSEIIDTHEGGDDIVFEGYTPEDDKNTALLVPAPFDDIYIRLLEARIDYANGELGKYNNSLTAYNDAYDLYARHYNRKHMPKGKKFKYFGEPDTKAYQSANSVVKITLEED